MAEKIEQRKHNPTIKIKRSMEIPPKKQTTKPPKQNNSDNQKSSK